MPLATGVARDVTSNASGFYTAPNLVSGVYQVTASVSGGHLVLTDTSGGGGSLSVRSSAGYTTAASLGITSPAFAARADAVLAANRARTPTVVPDRIVAADPAWRHVATVEFYVDFETVSNLNDDFASLPKIAGQPMIVQVGCGHVDTAGAWCFAQWTVDGLASEEERRILDARQ